MSGAVPIAYADVTAADHGRVKSGFLARHLLVREVLISFGTSQHDVHLARAMGHDEAADLLRQNLDEEKAADEKLTSLAEAAMKAKARRR